MPNKEIRKERNPRNDSFRMARFWLEQIEDIDKLQKNWIKKGDDIIKRFRLERTEADRRRRLNMLWTNIKVLMPALYGKVPIPYVERRFLQRDPTARISATILERVLKNELEINGLHNSIRRAVLDYLLPGRGAVWIRYEPDVGEIGDSIPIDAQSSFQDVLSDIEGDDENEDPKSQKLETTGEQLLGEQIPVDYINWKDLYLFPATARNWTEVQAVGKRVYLSKQEAEQRFGENVAKELRYTTTNTEQNRKVPYTDTAIFQSTNYRNIVVYEIWNKVDRKIYWVSEGYDYLCDQKDDFLELKEFFPVPECIFATATNESLVPVPDYAEYADQALQIDELTHRLAMLTKACKIAGCYDGSNGSLKRLLQEGFENDLIPVDAWVAFAEKGGVQGGIALLPIEEIQKVIETLTKVRQQQMIDLDTMTGLSDVIRGTTDSRETLGGIRLKNNNAGTRLSDRQNEIANFAKNIICVVAEIAARHYSDRKLVETSNILYDDDMQPQAILEEVLPPLQDQQQQQQGQQTQQQPQQQIPLFQGGVNSIGVQPQQQIMTAQQMGNVVPFPNLNPKAPPALNSPMGMFGQGLPMMPMPNIDPMEIIASRIMRAIELLRKDMPRGYRIDIETDSTIFGDVAQERQDAALFIGEMAKFLAGAATLGEQLPEAVPALCHTLLWSIRKFRIGRDVEAAWDDFITKIQKRVKDQLKNPKPDPEQQKAQAQIEGIKLKTAADQQKMQIEQQAADRDHQREIQKQQAEFAQEQQIAQMEMQIKQQEHQMKLKEMMLKHQLEVAKLTTEIKKMGMEAQIDQQHLQMEQQNTQMETVAHQQEHQQTMEQNAQQHQQSMEQTKMQGQQAREQHQQTMQQTELKGRQSQAQHNQKMQQMKQPKKSTK